MHVGRMVAAVPGVKICTASSPYGPCRNHRALATVDRCYAHASPAEREAIEVNAQCHRLWLYIHGGEWFGMPRLFRNSRQRPPWVPRPGRVVDDAGLVSLLREVFGR